MRDTKVWQILRNSLVTIITTDIRRDSLMDYFPRKTMKNQENFKIKN